MIGYIIAGIVILALIFFIITKYNKLVRLRNNVQNAFAQIETHLQRRFYLITNLVETVKGYKIKEKDIFFQVKLTCKKYLFLEKFSIYNRFYQ